MNIIQPESVSHIAHSVEIRTITNEASETIASDVEYRISEIIQDAMKFARHCNRTKLNSRDIESAFRLRNIEPPYGILGTHQNPIRFLRCSNHPNLYFAQDRPISVLEMLNRPLPRPPLQTSIVSHWLFVEGVQPRTAENPHHTPLPSSVSASTVPSSSPSVSVPPSHASGGLKGHFKGSASLDSIVQSSAPGLKGGDSSLSHLSSLSSPSSIPPLTPAEQAAAAQVTAACLSLQLPVHHIVSDELQKLYVQLKLLLLPVTDASTSTSVGVAGTGGNVSGSGSGSGSGSSGSSGSMMGGGAKLLPPLGVPQLLVVTPPQRVALASIQSDPSMQQLLPYFAAHIPQEVSGNLRHMPRLEMALRVLRALLLNPHINLEHYLHALLPVALTCVLAKSLGGGPGGFGHWQLRREAASLVALICARFGEPLYTLQLKVIRQYLRALLDPCKPLACHYGAVVGLQALGPGVVMSMLMPQLEPYTARLSPLLDPDGFRESILLTSRLKEEETRSSPGGISDNRDNRNNGNNGNNGNNNSILLNKPKLNANGDVIDRGITEGRIVGGIKSGSAAHLEAWIVFGAIMEALGHAMYDKVLRLAADVVPHGALSRIRSEGQVVLREPLHTPSSLRREEGEGTRGVKRRKEGDRGEQREEREGGKGGGEEGISMEIDKGNGGKEEGQEEAKKEGEEEGKKAREIKLEQEGREKWRRDSKGRREKGDKHTPDMIREALVDPRVIEAEPGRVFEAMSSIFGEAWVARLPQPHGFAQMFI
eukprot:CAMPEP_0175042318 /NCGR_PEP_ID=MMETSP0052_2-20121109/2489_1 /TAXON_ID=51329 ORGANISM="Polytomella parva, Strain SAG 63-3" /NCGR_SAMPLE_ID=MMETSP0052_2 /ASSEMBLY_ACC=CAM_ASM_000194 /LENGTH=764 /DNA_ID=CAMNT_0016305101 /DNA_START=26 /DNA_END=2320 /DNA_ORIENTATION=-